MKKLIFIVFVVLLISFDAIGQNHILRSPNRKAEVRLRIAEKVYYSIFYDGQPVIAESAIALAVRENPGVGVNPKVAGKKERSVDQIVPAIVPEKRRKIKDNFNELQLTFEGGYGLVWRVYDNGAAYRWTTDLSASITIVGEESEINLNPQDTIFYPQEESFYSHNERLYTRYKSGELKNQLASLPAVVASRSGVKVWLSEADLYDYAGMWLEGAGGKGLKAVFPFYPSKEEQASDRDLKVAERADYIAKTNGRRRFPWRVFGLAARDAELLDNQLVYLLSEDTKEDFSWVRPGKVPWDWWNANNVFGVDFKSGVNTETYKYYIDFAAKYGLEYLVLDEGWSKTDDLLTINPDVNLPELLAYAKQKKVGIVLWVVWLTLDKQWERAFDQFEKWGVQGIKVDFMQRDDQKMVNFYERTAKEAARRKMLVDFHGAYKPTGLNRKYPNALTREGVQGLEHNKWSKDDTPRHNLDLPFIRMVAGGMDFTPGAMRNAGEKDFQIEFNRPMSQGTRAHQLAMYVIYESPLQMLADSPSNYLREPEAMEFLAAVPTVWNETVALDGRIGEYAVIARQADRGDWYVGAMTDWTPRELTLDLSFLDAADYEAQIIEDGINASRMTSDFKKYLKAVKKGDKLTIKMAAGGGFVARIVKK
jgi:alpha-glucosidase